MVLLIGYGKWLLGGGDVGAGKRNSAFITPSGLFEWLRMPFGLKNSPQINQRLIDNALYGYLKIGTRPTTIASESSGLIDVFTTANQILT